MKKIKLLVGIALIAMAGVFTSCEEDGTTTGPSLSFFGGAYIDENVTVEPGATLRWHWLAEKGDKNLDKFEVLLDGSYIQGYPNEDIDNDSYQDSLVIEAPSNDGTYGYDFIITDRDGNTAQKEFIVTVEETSVPVDEFTAKIMGAHENPTYGSFLDASTGDVYKVADAKDNQEAIDLLYYWGATNGSTVASPDDTDAEQFNVYDLENWTTRNATRLTGTLTTDFASIETSADIDGAVSSPGNTKANELAVDDVVGFETVDGKKGLFKVTNIDDGTDGYDGYIEIDIKIQP